MAILSTLHHTGRINKDLILQRIPRLLHNKRCNLTLQSNTVEQVVTYISTHPCQLFLYLVRVQISHYYLFQIGTHAGEGEPAGKLAQLNVRCTILISETD